MAKRRTQAFVIIHGIGEQRPMDTLRGFVESVLPQRVDGGERYFSKPDRMSEELELRKLQDRDQPRTHFYEYYWAYKVEGTTVAHVITWLRALLLRRPSRVPGHLVPLWTLTWGLLLTATGAWLWYAATRGQPLSIESLPLIVASVASLALLLVQGIVIGYVGDAARYLSPHPGNIALRHRIRADGVKLLRKLHDSGKYDRIVVVGHSLGSVIAYDVLTHLWQEVHQVYEKPSNHAQAALAAVEGEGATLPSGPTDENVSAYHTKQTECWWELRELGNPWLVTDLVTLGSPLAHAALLLAADVASLETRKRQRELPAAPPVPEIESDGRKRYSFRVWDKYEDDKGREHVLRAIHHGGVFGVTRWTNLFFPTRLALLGDFIGGPLAPWFGPGIRDRRVRGTSWWRTRTPLAHTSYWGAGSNPSVENDAVQVLVDSLDRSGVRTFKALAHEATGD